MGFRDLTVFNQAMLTKQSWRIIRYPDSFLSRVLRGRYFKIGHFLKAQIGNNTSYTWRSFIWGRDLFKKDNRWRVGNGLQVKVATNPWIPKEGASTPIFVNRPNQHFTVAQLLSPNRTWRVDLIREMFLEKDVEDILNIPLCQHSRDGEIIWSLDLQCQNVEDVSVSGNGFKEALWKKFWKTRVPAKIKVCGWKIYNDILPTKTNLINSGVDINSSCLFCRNHPETMKHLLWESKMIRGIWASLFPFATDFFVADRSGWIVPDYCESLWRGSRGEAWEHSQMQKSLLICWQIWNYQNSIFHNHQQPNINFLQQQIHSSLLNLEGQGNTYSSIRRDQVVECSIRHPTVARQWAESSFDVWVLHNDASWCERKMDRIGWILRWGDGSLMSTEFRNILHQWKVSWLEALAVIEGLKSIPLAPPS